MRPKKIAAWIIAGALAAAAVVLFVMRLQHWRPRSITIQGAVIRRDADTRKETPISNAVITLSDRATRITTNSGASGYFKVTFRERVWPAETVNLDFHHPDYKPLNMKLQIGLHSGLKRLYIAAMQPVAAAAPASAGRPVAQVSNLRIRYTVNYRTDTNVGTSVKTFQVVDTGNEPCNRSHICSPGGLWKASRGSVTLDAGAGNVFRNVRASCIAGPCPFTKIDSSGFVHGGQSVSVSAIAWSGTATFLVEAEVFQQTIASGMRESYPVIYGRDLHFTLPPTAEGPSIEAEIGNTPMVFPLGGDLYMSWAICNSRTSPQSENSTVYQCVLKTGFRF
ncbi:MAG: hypothetical protein ACRD3N_02010 [Terracidiphilus sp.]